MYLFRQIFLLLIALLFSGVLQARSQFTLPAPLYALTVKTTPANARVRIMNIKPVYRDGIKLKSGVYRLEISAKGYQVKKEVIRIRQDKKMYIVLDKKSSIRKIPPSVVPAKQVVEEEDFVPIPPMDTSLNDSTQEHVVELQISDFNDSDLVQEEVYVADDDIPVYTMTRGFKNFLGYANELYGVSYHDARFINYCKRYAKLAVRQAKRRVKSGCTKEINPLHNDAAKQWSLKKGPQKKWCRTVSSHATARETIYREKRLQSCIQNK